MPFSLAKPSLSQSAAKINPEMIREAQNSKSQSVQRCLANGICRDVSTPLDMTQMESKTAGLVFEPGRCELMNVTVLESLLQSDVPEPAFDGGN
jgi:hypothetical protein